MQGHSRCAVKHGLGHRAVWPGILPGSLPGQGAWPLPLPGGLGRSTSPSAQPGLPGVQTSLVSALRSPTAGGAETDSGDVRAQDRDPVARASLQVSVQPS